MKDDDERHDSIKEDGRLLPGFRREKCLCNMGDHTPCPQHNPLFHEQTKKKPTKSADDLRMQARTLRMVAHALARAQRHLFTRPDDRVCTFSIHPPGSLGSWPVTLSRDRAVKIMAQLEYETTCEVRELEEAISEMGAKDAD